jgi:hypothetical protein
MIIKSTKSIIYTGRIVSLLIVIFTITLILPITAFSQFQGNPVSIAVNNQINPMMTTDGSGGTIIT